VPDRRTSVQSSFRPLSGDPLDDSASQAPTGTHAALTDAALRVELAELRHALNAHIDNQFERIGADLRALVHDALMREPVVPLPAPGPRSWGWTVAALALAAAVVTTALWQHEVNLRAQATADAAAVRAPLPAAAPAAARAEAPKSGASARAEPLIEPVPYGEEPLGGVRFEKVSQLLYRLAGEKYSGVVEIKSFPGRFCLVGNATDGYSLGPDEMLFARCDAVGNPREGAQLPAQRVSLPLANLLGDIRHTTRGALDVQLSAGDAATTVVPYPQVAPGLTAGEWNRAGNSNNRIEIRLR
jgi:hypothetical protein